MVLDSYLVANKIIEDWPASTFRFDALKKNVSALITIKNAFKRFCNDYY